MTLSDSSNKLSAGSFSSLRNKQWGERGPCVSSQLFSFMNVHVISSARWRYNPRAVAWEFSLAREQQTQRHHTALIGCFYLFALTLLAPNSDREQLLRRCFECSWDFYFLWQGKKEHKRGLLGFGSAASWRDVWKECQSFFIWIMLIRPWSVGVYCRWPVMPV